MLRVFYIEENSVKDFSSNENICSALIRELFIEKPDLIYSRMIQIFYSNLKLKGVYIISKIGQTNTSFTMEESGVLNKIPSYEKSYFINFLDNFTNYDLVFVIGSFLIKIRFMKATSRIVHHLMICVLPPRKDKCDVLLKEYVTPM